MSSCKDCICYEILCRDTLQENELKLCRYFKNKADFVEVVRCKDCRNRIEKNWAKCAGRKPDDFCSDGIRRTEIKERF